VILLCFILLNIAVDAKFTRSSNDEIIKTDFINKGWMEEQDGVKILHLKGSFYEMGYQLGFFLKYEIIRNLRAFGLHELNEKNLTCSLWEIQKDYIPIELVDYIQGTADAVALSYDDIGCMWTWEKKCSLHCSSFIADGPVTKSNELIHVYSLDFPGGPKDPITGFCVLDEPILVVGKPDGFNAFMYPSFAGYVVESGMNDKGITISNTASPCNDEKIHGSPVGIRLLEALYKSSTLEEALVILDVNKTFGYDYLISDVNKEDGYVLEQTANISYLGQWDGICESKFPFYTLNHIIRRTNCFVNPETSATQRDIYNSLHPRNVFDKKSFAFVSYVHYRMVSLGCQEYTGDNKKLDLSNSLESIRNAYNLEYGSVFMFLLHKFFLGEYNAWYQWSYTPFSGDLLICYASSDKTASENPIHHFNFYELLDT